MQRLVKKTSSNDLENKKWISICFNSFK